MKHIVNVISDKNIGGAGKMLLLYLKYANYKDFKHTIIIPRDSLLKPRIIEIIEKSIKENNKTSINYLEADFIADKSFSLKAVSEMLTIFKNIKPDVVHTHANLSARIAGKIYGQTKIVHTRHSVFDQRKLMKTFPLKQLNGIIYNYFSDQIIAVSPAAKDNIVEIGASEKKVVIIFNGVEKTTLLNATEKLEARKSFGIEENDFVCSIIARVEEVKGHDTILKAAQILKSYEKIKIIIAGTGDKLEHLKSMAKENKLTNCIFTGFIGDIYKIENITDLSLNASFGTEATSLSLLETMNLGIPSVVSNFGGNPFVIEDGQNGIIFKMHDEKALADAILKLYIDKSLYEKMSQNSKQCFNDRFTIEKMVVGIEKIYNGN